MADPKGSKDGRTWEEMIREDQNLRYNRFSDQQAIRNLTLLMEWSKKKIIELSEKKNEIREAEKPGEEGRR